MAIPKGGRYERGARWATRKRDTFAPFPPVEPAQNYKVGADGGGVGLAQAPGGTLRPDRDRPSLIAAAITNGAHRKPRFATCSSREIPCIDPCLVLGLGRSKPYNDSKRPRLSALAFKRRRDHRFRRTAKPITVRRVAGRRSPMGGYPRARRPTYSLNDVIRKTRRTEAPRAAKALDDLPPSVLMIDRASTRSNWLLLSRQQSTRTPQRRGLPNAGRHRVVAFVLESLGPMGRLSGPWRLMPPITALRQQQPVNLPALRHDLRTFEPVSS